MAKKLKGSKTKITIKPERTNFLTMLAINPNYFGNIPGSKLKAKFKMIRILSREALFDMINDVKNHIDKAVVLYKK